MNADRERGRLPQRAALALAALLASGTAGADCRLVRLAELSLKSEGNRLLVDATANGQPIRVLVDTGAALSFLTRRAAQRLGLRLFDHTRLGGVWGIGGKTHAEEAVVEDLRFGDFGSKSTRLAVLAMPQDHFDMVLGENFLGRFAQEFDLPHHALRLFRPEGCVPEQVAYWAPGASVATLRERTEDAAQIEITVQLNGHDVEAILDSGASVTIVSAGWAKTAGVERSQALPDSEQTIVGSGRGTLDSWVGLFDSFSFGGEVVRNAKLRVADLGRHSTVLRTGSLIDQPLDVVPPMLLGADFLHAHRVFVFGAARRVLFTYEGGPVFQVVEPPEPRESPAPSVPAAAPDGGTAR